MKGGGPGRLIFPDGREIEYIGIGGTILDLKRWIHNNVGYPVRRTTFLVNGRVAMDGRI
jgi:hypothetical protein